MSMEREIVELSAGGSMPEPVETPYAPFDDGPQDRLDLPRDYLSPWDQPIQSESLLGPFDCWVGITVEANADGTIEARRVLPARTTNNAIRLDDIPMAISSPSESRCLAMPWPPRSDQATPVAAPDDAVAILSGRDGRHYYFIDDLPFPAVVINVTGILDTMNDPPGGAAVGDKYVIGTGTGAWGGHDGAGATKTAGGWGFSDA
ncbi:MAG: DUF2793 domain-containing protein, partial [Phycisphaerae bacterium]|nr:DUF2793 domain-containing protein [Phycisphaerae bacterium]